MNILMMVLDHSVTALEPSSHLLIGQLVPGVVARPSPASTVASRPKRLLHALLSPSQDVRVCPHGAPNQDRLSSQLIIHRDERVVGRESPETFRRSLSLRTCKWKQEW